MAKSSGDYKQALSQLENFFELYLVKKAPEIPDKWKDIIVQLVPWFTLIGLFITASVLLPLIGLSAFYLPFSFMGGVNSGINNLVGMVFSLAIVLLEALAIPGLFKKKETGWRKLYWAALLSVVSSLLGGQLMGALITGLISLYILFQIKEKYS